MAPWTQFVMISYAEPAIVYDTDNDKLIEVPPDQLMEHFQVRLPDTTHSIPSPRADLTNEFVIYQRHPMHVIDVASTPGRVCAACRNYGKSFKQCHVDHGHPML